MKKTLDSGAMLEVTMAPFQDGYKLLKSVMKEAESINMNFGFKGKTFKELFEFELTDEFFNTLKNVLSRMISSDIIEEALWSCLSRCTYNNIKITKDLFDSNIEAREDFLVIAKEVIWFNLSPFGKNLQSMLKGISQKPEVIQK